MLISASLISVLSPPLINSVRFCVLNKIIYIVFKIIYFSAVPFFSAVPLLSIRYILHHYPVWSYYTAVVQHIQQYCRHSESRGLLPDITQLGRDALLASCTQTR